VVLNARESGGLVPISSMISDRDANGVV